MLSDALACVSLSLLVSPCICSLLLPLPTFSLYPSLSLPLSSLSSRPSLSPRLPSLSAPPSLPLPLSPRVSVRSSLARAASAASRSRSAMPRQRWIAPAGAGAQCRPRPRPHLYVALRWRQGAGWGDLPAARARCVRPSAPSAPLPLAPRKMAQPAGPSHSARFARPKPRTVRRACCTKREGEWRITARIGLGEPAAPAGGYPL